MESRKTDRCTADLAQGVESDYENILELLTKEILQTLAGLRDEVCDYGSNVVTKMPIPTIPPSIYRIASTSERISLMAVISCIRITTLRFRFVNLGHSLGLKKNVLRGWERSEQSPKVGELPEMRRETFQLWRQALRSGRNPYVRVNNALRGHTP